MPIAVHFVLAGEHFKIDSPCVPFPPQTMGRSGKHGKGSKGQQPSSRGRESEGEAEHLRPVDGRWHLTKSSLRPYASSSGSPFYAARQQSDTDFLSLGSIASALQTWTSEICTRPGIALSEAGGTIGMGQSLLFAYCKDGSAAGEKLGFTGVVEILQTEEGKKFLAAAAAFDKFDDTAKNAAALQTAAKDWVAFLSTDPKGKAKRLQRMVKTAATTYIFGIEILQWLAAMEHRDDWAAKLRPGKRLQPDKLQKWLKSPSDDGRLREALLAAYSAQVEVRREAKTRQLSDSDKSEAAAGPVKSSTSTSSSSNSSSSNKKSRKNKSKKKQAKKDKKKSAKKKHSKDKTKKDKKSGSSQHSGKSRKGNPAGASVMKIRRVTGLSSDGRVSVKDTDIYDEIKLEDKESTVAVILERFFELQSTKEVKVLLDGKYVGIQADAMPAALCPEVVLLRKGG